MGYLSISACSPHNWNRRQQEVLVLDQPRPAGWAKSVQLRLWSGQAPRRLASSQIVTRVIGRGRIWAYANDPAWSG